MVGLIWYGEGIDGVAPFLVAAPPLPRSPFLLRLVPPHPLQILCLLHRRPPTDRPEDGPTHSSGLVLRDVLPRYLGGDLGCCRKHPEIDQNERGGSCDGHL